MKKILLILPLFLLISCSEQNNDPRELPTKYPDTATMRSAVEVTEELNKN